MASPGVEDGIGLPPDLTRLDRRTDLRTYLGDLWGRRDFILVVPRTNIQVKHLDTVLGNLWHVLNPLLMVGVYFLIFGVILDVSRGVDNFLAFLTIGIFIFQYTRRSAGSGASSIIANEGLIRSIRFPRAALPISSVIEESIAFLPSLLVMFGFALATGETPGFEWFLLAPLLVIQGVFNLGLALFLARATTHFRDITNLLPFIFRIWFYLSGILFPVRSLIDDPFFRRLFDLNPMYDFVTIARDVIFRDDLPDFLWLLAAAWAVVALVVGFAYFRGAETEYGRG